MSARTQEAIAQAKELISSRKYSEAVRACRRVLLSQPHDVPVRLLLGQALLAMGRHDEVRIEMLALLKRAPEVGAVHRMLGEAYMRGGKLDEASASLRTALHLDPNDDEARDLLEEVGEVDAPPKIETVDRWFADPPTENKPVYFPPPDGELEFDDATVDRAPSLDEEFEEPTRPGLPADSTAISKSVELDPEFARELSAERGLPLDGENTQIPSIGALERESTRVPRPPPSHHPPSFGHAPPPQRRADLDEEPTVAPRRPRPTALGLGPKSSMPLPPPGMGGAPIAGPPGASAPAPTSGGLPPGRLPSLSAPAGRPSGASQPGPRPAFGAIQPAGTAELSAEDLQISGGPLSASTGQLSAEDLEPVSGPLGSKTGQLSADDLLFEEPPSDLQLLGGGTAELDSADLEPATQELGSVDLEQVGGHDPYDSLGELAPLEGEATHARAPLSSRDVPRAPEAIVFDDETARGKRGPPSPAARPPAGGPIRTGDEDETTTARPAIADFPEDDIDTGLPPLDGEATLARPVEASNPFGALAVSATPIGHPMIRDAVTVTPIGHPTVGDPPSVELIASASNTPITPQDDAGGGFREKLAALKLGGKRWPPHVLAALFGVPVLLVALIAFGISSYRSSRAEEDVRSAARRAADEGTLESLRAVLELDADVGSDEGPATARRALLYSMAVIEHGAPESARAQTLLASLEPAVAESALARIARAYLSLAAGRVEEAEAALEPVPTRAVNGEADYARALLELERADLDAAIRNAREAQSARPTAPRYAALLARALARNGDADALTLANQIVQATPTVRVAKVFALLAADRDSDAKAEAEAVLALPETSASRRQRALASLGLAQAEMELGDADASAGAALRARELGPVQSEDFLLEVASVLLASNHLDEAKATLELLPDTPANPGRRALVSAEVFLAAGDTEQLATVLDSAPNSHQTAYLRGRLSEARGDLRAARSFYDAAALGDQLVAARTRLGAIDLREGNAEDAIENLEMAFRQAPGNAEVTLLLVRAHLANEDPTEAAAVVDRSLRANPDDLRIRAAQAEVELARGQFEDALRTFRDLAGRMPGDPDIHASLGSAALLAGELETAQSAIARALELAPRHRRALLAKIELALRSDDAAAADAAIEAAEDIEIAGDEIELAKARLSLLRGEGRIAALALGRLIPRDSRDARLIAMLGHAHLQAESLREATRSFNRALGLDDDNFEAMVGLAHAQVLAGRDRDANNTIDRAERLVRRDEMGPRAEAAVAFVRGRYIADFGSTREAIPYANTVLEKDPEGSNGHLLKALIADYLGDSPLEHLRAAAEARTPLPEVLGRLAIRTRNVRQRCEYKARYVRYAPNGIDSREVGRVRCR